MPACMHRRACGQDWGKARPWWQWSRPRYRLWHGGRLAGLKDRLYRGRPSVYTPAVERIMWRKVQDACRFAVTTVSLDRLCSPIGRCLMQPLTKCLSARQSVHTVQATRHPSCRAPRGPTHFVRPGADQV